MKKLTQGHVIVLLSLSMILIGCGDPGQRAQQDDPVPAERRDVVNSTGQASDDIEAEKTRNNQRVGIVLTDPSPIYRDGEIVSNPEGASHQLRVVLREQRTGRTIPGAPVNVRFLDHTGNTLKRLDLTEVRGPYLFYGTNTKIPSEASIMAVTVGYSRVGRGAEMNEISTETFSVEFYLSRENNTWQIRGPSPTPLRESDSPGRHARIALEAPLKFKTDSPYKIGLITEPSATYWSVHEHGTRAHLHPVEGPEGANRYLGIVLLDAETNRVIPHADVSLELKPSEKGGVIRGKLPFQLAEFHHYGHNFNVPPGRYRVSATIKRPDVARLNQDVFPDSVSVRFNWENKLSEENDNNRR